MRLGLGSRRRRDDGAAAVEFALIFTIILVPLLMGMMQYGWYFYSSQVTSSAARETARRLSVGDCQTGTSARDYARGQSGFSTLTLDFGSTATPTSNTLPAAGEILRVTASFDGKIIGLLPMPNDAQITRVVEARVEDTVEDTPCT